MKSHTTIYDPPTHSPSVWTLIVEAVMSVVIVKYGIHRSCNREGPNFTKSVTLYLK